MYLLYADETNTNPEQDDFFIYGGLTIPISAARDLSDQIEAIRRENGYRRGDALKFNTQQRAAHITPDQHKEAKRQLINACVSTECNLLIVLILHAIAKDRVPRHLRQLHTLLLNFDSYCHRRDAMGLVLVDTFQEANLPQELRETFSHGLSGLPFSAKYPLSRLLGLHVSSIGTSHFCSAIDVCLGAFRWALNSRGDDRKRAAASGLLQELSGLFLRDGKGKVSTISLRFNPKQVRAPQRLRQYEAMLAFLSESGLDCVQSLSDPERRDAADPSLIPARLAAFRQKAASGQPKNPAE